jgi:hypothetical protein
VQTIAEELSDGKEAPLERAAAAYAYAAKSVRYGRPPAETLSRNIRTASQVLQDLRGDCKDKSALLVQLLRAMELDARIAVVLTGDSGRAPFLPSGRFNHALVRLEHAGQVHWLDPAAGPFAFGELPAIDLEISALVLGRGTFAFDQIPAPGDDAVGNARRGRGRLLADGSYEFELEADLANEPAARLRYMLMDRDAQHQLEVLQSWLGNEFEGAACSGFSHPPPEDLSRQFSVRARVRLEGVMRRIQDLGLVRVPWSAPLLMNGPMASLERRQPLLLPFGYRFFERHEIELPEGAVAYALPDPVEHQSPWGTYRLAIAATAGGLACERELRLAGGAVPGEQYREYREFWRQCSWADRAEVVLRTGRDGESERS